MDTTGIQISRPARVPFVTIAAVAIALLVGAALGSLITNAMTDAGVSSPVTTTWDPYKLEAMQGRQLFTATPVPAVPWDEQKLDAMAARQLAS